MDISKICIYENNDLDATPVMRISYLEHHESPSNKEIKKINRDIKIDILEGNKNTSDILEYNSFNIPNISIVVKSMDVDAIIFSDKISAYNFIIDKIISTATMLPDSVDIYNTEESMRKLHFSLIKETMIMSQNLRRNISLNNCVIFLNPLNKNIRLNSFGLTGPRDIIYSNSVPDDELIINSIGDIGEIGLNVFESKNNSFYIADIKAENAIKKIKLKRLP